MAIDGQSGSGKTKSLLRIAFELAKLSGGGRVAVIDTEHGSASKYQGETHDGNLFDFDVLELDTFAPTEYTNAIIDAGKAEYAVLVIDSLSHAWTGEGGALEIKDRLAGDDKNSFTAWKAVTPMHTRMIEAIISAPMHVLCSMRMKTEYVIEENEKGKKAPRKIGVAPIQRSGMEYEFDVYGTIDDTHLLKISKSRCDELQDAAIMKPGASTARTLFDWLNTGEAELPAGAIKKAVATDAQVERLTALTMDLELAPGVSVDHLMKKYGAESHAQLTVTQADELEAKLVKDLEGKRRRDALRAKATAGATSGGEATAAQVSTTPTTAPGKTTDAQIQTIVKLRKDLNIKDAAQWSEQVMKPFGVASAKDLSSGDADRLVKSLELRLLLARHDWWHMMSDDSRAVRAGEESFAKVVAAVKAFPDADEAKRVWSIVAPKQTDNENELAFPFPVVTPPTTAPATTTAPTAPTAPIQMATKAQIDRFRELKKCMAAVKGYDSKQHADQIDRDWFAYVKAHYTGPLDRPKAIDLTEPQAAALIAELEPLYVFPPAPVKASSPAETTTPAPSLSS